MASATSARRYAQAILELALEHDELDLWRTDLGMLDRIWSDPDLRAYLEDVRISKQQRLDRARRQLESHLGPRAMNMTLLLISRGRSSLIPYIMRQFDDLERQREQTVVAHVTAAAPMTAEQQEALKAQLARQTGKEVQLEVQVDPSLLGGLVVRVGDQLLDMSVLGKLRRLREQVVGRATPSRA